MPVASVKRPQKPKVLVGAFASDSDADKHDGIDCVNEANIFRGYNTSYAIPRDAINADLRKPGFPIAKLLGDGFAINSESALYLLGDLTSAIGGGVLTNNGTATFVTHTTDDESTLYEKTVLNLVAASSQYLSRATEAQFEVGTGSFILSIQFNTTTTSTAMKLAFYGDEAASEQNYYIAFNASGQLIAVIDDGTNAATLTDTIPNRFQDGRDHTVTLLVDKTTNLMHLVVDNAYVGNTSISAVTLTLNNVGTNFQVGAGNSGGVQHYFNGRLSNWHLIKAADYNAVGVLQAGIRERVALNGTLPVLAASASARMTNTFLFADNDADYVTAVVNLEDGEYEIQEVYEKNTTRGKVELYLSGVLVRAAVDFYNGSQTFNNKNITRQVKIAAGTHIVKLKINDKNGSSTDYFAMYQFINFIKRKGHEEGGADRFLLLGDEINDIDSDGNTVFAVNTTGYYNNLMNRTTGNSDDLDYNQGTLFLRGGVWRIDLIYGKDTTCAKIDLLFGDVTVISALDSYNGSATQNNVKTVYVRINQGRNPIKIQANGKNGSSTDFQVNFLALRGERVSD